MGRRAFLTRVAALSATSVGGTAAYAWGVEPHWVETTRHDLRIARLPHELEGVALAQISDLHVGPRVDSRYLVGCLDSLAGLRPDLIAVTGDLLSFRAWRGEAQFAELRSVLAHLPRARLGTFAILGNHDYGPAWSSPRVAARVTEELQRAGAHVLRNGCGRVGGLDVVGVDDLWAHRADPKLALERRTGSASLVLCHNPDALDALDWGGYQGWVLAGHTHGGQCRLPFLAPPILPVRNHRYAAGIVRLPDGRSLYVNRGLGHLARVRFNVRPEISVFTLRREPLA